jgi:ubiquinone/menaquinone biosynthesis C-methylase UbiE/DNA-binding transcriptional ArsR family regulator
MEQVLAGLRAVGERTRLRILFLLSHGELTVKELTVILNQSQPRVSRHVKLLGETDLVKRYREGSWVFLRLAERGSAGAFVQMIADLLPDGDEVLRNDLKRLEKVKAARASKAAQFFDSNAENWDRIRSLHVAEDDVERAMKEAVGPARFETFVDAGTGTGRVLELFASQAKSAIGIDASHEMLAIARARMEQNGLRQVQVRHGDIFEMPFADASVDLVTVHQVLHFLDDPAVALGEAARILTPSGRVLVVDFAPHEQEFLRDEQAHHRLGITDEQMHRWAEHGGLEIADHQSLPPDLAAGGGLTVSLWLATKAKAAA